MKIARRRALALFGAALAAPNLARAQAPAEVRIVQQFGLTYLPLVIARQERLIEKHAARVGLRDLRVTWSRVGGGAAANDALLSGAADYVSAGLGPFLTAWDRTRGNLDVRGVAALDASALFLNTNNPRVTTIADFGERDRIALPAVRVSHQAVLLQIAAEKLWGQGQHGRLDRFTVALAHPDASSALLSGTEVTAHFSNAPFGQLQLKSPNIRRVTTSNEILGGPSTVTSLYTTARVRDASPLRNASVLAALAEAQTLIAEDRARAARIYAADEGGNTDVGFLTEILGEPTTRYDLAPISTHVFADFMHRTGALRTRPESWRDYYFPDLHARAGS
jgi:NitT/TauT family transport system substrate-binding protein